MVQIDDVFFHKECDCVPWREMPKTRDESNHLSALKSLVAKQLPSMFHVSLRKSDAENGDVLPVIVIHSVSEPNSV